MPGPPTLTRLNRNSRVREILQEFDTVRARMLVRVTEVLRDVYPEGTIIRWGATVNGPWFEGRVLEWDEIAASGRILVKNVVKGSKSEWITAYQILWGGDGV